MCDVLAVRAKHIFQCHSILQVHRIHFGKDRLWLCHAIDYEAMAQACVHRKVSVVRAVRREAEIVAAAGVQRSHLPVDQEAWIAIHSDKSCHPISGRGDYGWIHRANGAAEFLISNDDEILAVYIGRIDNRGGIWREGELIYRNILLPALAIGNDVMMVTGVSANGGVMLAIRTKLHLIN